MTLRWTAGNKIDANLIPSNIKDWVTIFGVEESFEGIGNTNGYPWITIPLFSSNWEIAPGIMQRIYDWWACWEYWDKIYSMVHGYPWSDQYMYILYYEKSTWNVWIVWNIWFSSPSFEEHIISIKTDWNKIITNTTSNNFVFDMETELLTRWWWEYVWWVAWSSFVEYNWKNYKWYSINRILVWSVLWRNITNI